MTFHITQGGTSLLGIDAVQALGLEIVGPELRCLTMATEPNVDTKGPKMHPQHSNKLSPPTTKPPESEKEIASLVTSAHHDELRRATVEDSTLQEVSRYVQTSWPFCKNLAPKLTP